MRLSPLHDLHVELGAKFTEFAGWEMPLRYGSERREHQAVRQAAGLFDLSHMGEIAVVDRDAGAVLDDVMVSELSAIPVGRAHYTMLCNEAGGVLDDVVVYRRGPENFLVVANASNVEVVFSKLAEDARGLASSVEDQSSECVLLALQGPLAEGILTPLSSVDLAALPNYHCAEGTVDGAEVLVARTGYTGSAGFEIFVSPENGPRIWRTLLASDSVLPAGLSARDTLRLEAGMALYGNELTPDLTPYHARLGRLVKLSKPKGFTGAEALSRVAAGPISPLLVGLVGLPGHRSPRHDCIVVEPTTGEPVGRVTSAAPSPTLERPIAMAYVSANLATPGTVLNVEVRGQPEVVEVVKLPFYRRDSGSQVAS